MVQCDVISRVLSPIRTRPFRPVLGLVLAPDVLPDLNSGPSCTGVYRYICSSRVFTRQRNRHTLLVSSLRTETTAD